MSKPLEVYEQYLFDDWDTVFQQPFAKNEVRELVAFILLPDNDSLPYSAIKIAAIDRMVTGDSWDNVILDYMIEELPGVQHIFGITNHLPAKRAIARVILAGVLEGLRGRMLDDADMDTGEIQE
jgi:hypothetical protein